MHIITARSAFLRSWASIKENVETVERFIRVMPLRSPMSIFSKSPDLEKCALGREQ